MPIEFQLIAKDGGQTNRAIATWSRGDGGFTASFDVKYRIGGGNYKTFNTTDTSLTVDGIKTGKILEVKVRAVGIGFPVKKSAYVRAEGVVPDLSTNLDNVRQQVPNVSGVTITPVSFTRASLRWQAPVNERLEGFAAIIKHSSKTDNTATFSDSVKLAEVSALANAVDVPLMSGEYLIKLQDKITKTKSATTASTVLSIPDTLPQLLVQTRREDTDSPPFQGEKHGVFYSDEFDGLVLDGDAFIDDVLLIDDVGRIDFVGNRLTSGEYEFPSVLDLGGKFQANLNRIINSRGLYPSDLIDDRTELVDSWTDWDGQLVEDTSAVLYFRVSNEAPTADDILLEASPDFFLFEDGDKMLQESSTDYGEWTVLDKSTFVGRTFQFKAELEADHPDQTPLVEELGYQLSIPARTESSATIASGAGAKVVTFTNAFYQAPSVGITAFNLATGDYHEVTSVTRTGFTVHFRNSSNSSVDRNFQYVAAGFGSEQT